nr:trpA [Tsunamia transpacifica]
MASISDTFSEIQSSCALIPFITAGDPNLATTRKAIEILIEEGADLIEIGIPYSDPLADGPTIQAASARAIQNGAKFSEILELVQEITEKIQTPLIAFTYYNLILNQGISQFVSKIRDAGFKGLLVPDLPLEESSFVEQICSQNDLDLILLIGPNSPLDRVEKITKKSQGCVYLVSTTGVTGMSFGPHQKIQNLIQQIKKISNKALILGFGISTQKDIQLVQSWGINGVVIGSSFVQKLAEDLNDPELSNFRRYCKYVKQALVSHDQYLQ